MNLEKEEKLSPYERHELINQTTKIKIGIDMILSGNNQNQIIEEVQNALSRLLNKLDKMKD